MPQRLEGLLDPKSVALIGASANPAKLSYIALANLKIGAFKLYPVSSREKTILGLRCFPSVLDIPAEVDMAVVSLPAEAAIEPVRQCVKKGVKIVIVTASGFGESGSEGLELQNSLVNAIRGSKTRLLGPNTMGVLVPRHGLDTLFIPRERSTRPGPGRTAMLSQSGAVSVSFLERARAAGMGVSACIGLGNKADITENDLLELMARDEETRSIAMYLESFADGREFTRLASKITPGKPIVLLKSGRTRSGMTAASSHTGAMATSSEQLVQGALAQAGVARVYDEEELIDVAKAMACVGQLRGDRICIVASAGGYGVIASDLVESTDHGASLQMARLSENTKDALRRVVPGYSSVENPVDLTAAVTDDMYDLVLGILQDDLNVDGIMMSLELQPPNVTSRLVEVGRRRALSGKTPIVMSVFAGAETDELVRSLGEQNVLAYPTIWRAIRALAALARRGTYLRRRK